jgi:hypothetical protein
MRTRLARLVAPLLLLIPTVHADAPPAAVGLPDDLAPSDR